MPAFLFSLIYTSHNGRGAAGYLNRAFGAGLAFCCAVGMLLSTLFSYMLWDFIPLHFGNMPLFVYILYGRLRNGIVLGFLQLIAVLLMADHSSSFMLLQEIVLVTGWIWFPLLISLRKSFVGWSQHIRKRALFLIMTLGQAPSLLEVVLSNQKGGGSNGDLLVLLVTAVAVAYIVSGVFVHLLENVRELAYLREEVSRLTRQYESEAEKLKQIMNAAPVNIVILDRQGTVSFINETFLQLYRKDYPYATTEDTLGKYLEQECHGLHLNLFSSRVSKTLERKEKSTELVQMEDKAFFTSISPILAGDTEEVVGAIIVFQDITELEALRSELNHVERLSLVGQMAAGITHEIRNPMAVVRGFLQLMREKSTNDLDHYYRIVMDELDRANSIINDFLALAQNRLVTKELCSLDHIIEELTPLLWADANLRGQSIEFKLDERIPRLLLNVKEIKQLILNLSRNGLEAMGPKGLLTVGTRLETSGVVLYVSDTGPGISPTQQERLFAPFYTTKEKGTGLGLPLCLSIMERHGGKISVQSREGEGTMFICEFPLDNKPSSLAP